jgi:hypothetical protein
MMTDRARALIGRRWVGAALGCVLAAGPLRAADDSGSFAISGAGALSCADYVAAHDEAPERYRLFGSWMSGFFTGVNAVKDQTYDILPWHSPDLIASVLHRHCQDNPEQPFAAATMSVAQHLSAQRIERRSDKVTIAAKGAEPATLYKAVVERVQTRLRRDGLYRGEVDGALGEQTAAALLAYQKANDLALTGQPDQLTLWRMFQKP